MGEEWCVYWGWLVFLLVLVFMIDWVVCDLEIRIVLFVLGLEVRMRL